MIPDLTYLCNWEMVYHQKFLIWHLCQILRQKKKKRKTSSATHIPKSQIMRYLPVFSGKQKQSFETYNQFKPLRFINMVTLKSNWWQNQVKTTEWWSNKWHHQPVENTGRNKQKNSWQSSPFPFIALSTFPLAEKVSEETVTSKTRVLSVLWTQNHKED